jgi:hypothetical protein
VIYVGGKVTWGSIIIENTVTWVAKVTGVGSTGLALSLLRNVGVPRWILSARKKKLAVIEKWKLVFQN